MVWQELAEEWEIQCMPTFMFIKNGEKVSKLLCSYWFAFNCILPGIRELISIFRLRTGHWDIEFTLAFVIIIIVIIGQLLIVSRGWAIVSACSILCCPLPYRVAPIFVQDVFPPLAWSPLSYFLVKWSPSGDIRGPSVVFEAVDVPCPGPLHLSHIADYIYDLSPFPYR